MPNTHGRLTVDCVIRPWETVMSLPRVMECEVFNAVHLMGFELCTSPKVTESATVLFHSIPPSLWITTQQSCLFITLPGIVLFSSGNRVFSFLSSLLWNLSNFQRPFFFPFFFMLFNLVCIRVLFYFWFCPIL